VLGFGLAFLQAYMKTPDNTDKSRFQIAKFRVFLSGSFSRFCLEMNWPRHPLGVSVWKLETAPNAPNLSGKPKRAPEASILHGIAPK